MLGMVVPRISQSRLEFEVKLTNNVGAMHGRFPSHILTAPGVTARRGIRRVGV